MVSDRVTFLNDAPVQGAGRYVVYWMQQSQRARSNPALEYAIARANELDCPVVVVFGLFQDYSQANERHFAFMLEGIAVVATTLRALGIRLVVRLMRPDTACLTIASKAALIVCDRGYLRHQKAWRDTVAREAGRQVVQVEGDVVVPVDHASNKREYAARTLRPKIERLFTNFLVQVKGLRPVQSSFGLQIDSDADPRDPESLLARLRIDRSVGRVQRFHGGTTEALRFLRRFLRIGLDGYDDARNDPSDPQCSNLSPYLHFGQISPVEIACKVQAAKGGSASDRASFLEELIVRRELAINFVHFEPDYDLYGALPQWAKKTLELHSSDARAHLYTCRELRNAETHDPWWNAAMTEMVRTGYMHNYMRMYWGKKILEWSATPEHAYRTALALNNKYFIDGRDPSSYTGVGWIFGLHDRPWMERAVFGTVRYMNARGLQRKFDLDRYVRWTQALGG